MNDAMQKALMGVSRTASSMEVFALLVASEATDQQRRQEMIEAVFVALTNLQGFCDDLKAAMEGGK